jgi:hypothetical protein
MHTFSLFLHSAQAIFTIDTGGSTTGFKSYCHYSALQKKNFEEMGSILQWTYLTSLVTLTLFIVLGMKLFR